MNLTDIDGKKQDTKCNSIYRISRASKSKPLLICLSGNGRLTKKGHEQHFAGKLALRVM